jgi:hypothetical protein
MQMRSIMAIAAAAVLGVAFAPPARAQVLRDFKRKPGQNSEATSATGLQVNETVTVNGNKDLSTSIQANDGGCVYGITLTGSPGLFDYVLNVDAKGPSGIGSGNMYLNFIDQSGDTYRLMIYSSTRSTHTVRYKSNQPAIMKIRWSNNGNSVTGQID